VDGVLGGFAVGSYLWVLVQGLHFQMAHYRRFSAGSRPGKDAVRRGREREVSVRRAATLILGRS